MPRRRRQVSHLVNIVDARLAEVRASQFWVDLNVDIRSAVIGGKFSFSLFTSHGPSPGGDIAFGPDDLANAHRHMLSDMTLLANGDHTAIERLARTGYDHFRTFFGTDVLDLPKHSAGRALNMCVQSDIFSFPWNFLYTRDPKLGIDPAFFLGTRFAVHCRMMPLGRDRGEPPYLMRTVGKHAEVMYGWCDQLQACVQGEVATIQAMAAAGTIRRAVELPELHDNDGIDVNVGTIVQAIETHRPRFIHLACHGQTGQHARERRLRLRANTYVSEEDLRNGDLRLDDHPIVFLNACDVGRVSPQFFTSFASYLLGIGARAVIAPECEVEDAAASAFAEVFLEHYFTRQHNLSDAMFAAKMTLFDQGSLVGFAYAIYGQASAKLA